METDALATTTGQASAADAGAGVAGIVAMGQEMAALSLAIAEAQLQAEILMAPAKAVKQVAGKGA